MSSQLIKQAAHLIRSSSNTVALTGAGLSTPSGIPDFRSPNAGIWTTVDPLAVASIWAFHERPEAFFRWFAPLAGKIRLAQPNPAHYALAELEQAGLLRWVITQNMDELHQRSGSRNVVELHGHLRSGTCLHCLAKMGADQLWSLVDGCQTPWCPACGGPVKPDVILFGEPLEYENLKIAQQAALECDVMIAAGSSLEVEPAADLPHLARRRGAKIILLNRQPTAADHIAEIVIRGDVATVLPELVLACRS